MNAVRSLCEYRHISANAGQIELTTCYSFDELFNNLAEMVEKTRDFVFQSLHCFCLARLYLVFIYFPFQFIFSSPYLLIEKFNQVFKFSSWFMLLIAIVILLKAMYL